MHTNLTPPECQNIYFRVESPFAHAMVRAMALTDLITIDPEILGGTPVFKGTRVPVKALFEYIEDNYTLEQFLDCFPTVTGEMARRILKCSESALLSSAA